MDCWRNTRKKRGLHSKDRISQGLSATEYPAAKATEKKKRKMATHLEHEKTSRKRRRSMDIQSVVPGKKAKAAPPREIPSEVKELQHFENWGGKGSPLFSERGRRIERELEIIRAMDPALSTATSSQQTRRVKESTATFFKNPKAVNERLAFKSSEGVRTLPSGSTMGLVNIKGRDFSLDRTSPIDSLYQIVLPRPGDDKEFKSIVSII